MQPNDVQRAPEPRKTLPPVIGICGPARSGKDEIARLLAARHGYRRFAYADALRECLYVLDPWIGPTTRLSTAVDMLGWEGVKAEPELAAEVRRLLQRMGTEVGRGLISTDLWVHLLWQRIGAAQATRVVISDVRFADEAAAIVQRDGLVVRVERPDAAGLLTGALAAHVSEHQPIPYSHLLVNDGTLEQLEQRVSGLLSDARRSPIKDVTP